MLDEGRGIGRVAEEVYLILYEIQIAKKLQFPSNPFQGSETVNKYCPKLNAIKNIMFNKTERRKLFLSFHLNPQRAVHIWPPRKPMLDCHAIDIM